MRSKLTHPVAVFAAIIVLAVATLGAFSYARAEQPPGPVAVEPAAAPTNALPGPAADEVQLAPEDEQRVIAGLQRREAATAQVQQAQTQLDLANQYLRAEVNELRAKNGKHPDRDDIATRQTAPNEAHLFWTKMRPPSENPAPKRE